MGSLKVVLPAFVILLSIWILLSGIGYHKVYLDNQWPLERYEERQNGSFYFDYDEGVLKTIEVSFLGSYKKACNYGAATKPYCYAKMARYWDFDQVNTTVNADCVLELQNPEQYLLNTTTLAGSTKPSQQIDLKCFDETKKIIYLATYLEGGRKDTTPNYYMISTLTEQGYSLPDPRNPVISITPKN